jgi:hypothetical protein
MEVDKNAVRQLETPLRNLTYKCGNCIRNKDEK